MSRPSSTPAPMVKICGLTDEDGVAAAVENGADFLGFVFFPKSPRYVNPAEVPALIDGLPEDVRTVGLFVDPTDDELDAVFRYFRPDFVQLHGNESPERVEKIRFEYAVEAIKALSIKDAGDLAKADPYIDVADWLLFDAVPPEGADRPGGHGVAFDWSLLKSWKRRIRWFLAGGLTPENVTEALRASGAPAVDVSSGVEISPGVKDPEKIAAFLAACDAA